MIHAALLPVVDAWSLIAVAALAGGLGVALGRWSVLLQQRWVLVVWHEVRRWRRMRPKRRDWRGRWS